MAARKELTVADLRRAMTDADGQVGVLVDKVDGMEENFSPANYLKFVEFDGRTYLALGRTMKSAGVD